MTKIDEGNLTSCGSIVVIDVGHAHKGVIGFLRDSVRASECRRRGVRFLPEQVIRRLVFQYKPSKGTTLAVNPLDATFP